MRILLILDWTPTAKRSKNLGQDRIWTELMKKNCVIFVIKKLYFLFFGLYLDLDFEFLKLFGLWLDLD